PPSPTRCPRRLPRRRLTGDTPPVLAPLRSVPLQLRMLAGFLLGLGLGLIVNLTSGPDAGLVVAVTTYVTQPGRQILLRRLFMLGLPLLVSALVVGISEMGSRGALRRTGWRT